MGNSDSIWALIVAAGSGTRLASATGGVPKQFLRFRNAPLYWESALRLSGVARVAGIVFVFPEALREEQEAVLRCLDEGKRLGIPWRTAAGGARRQDSVYNGLLCLPRECGAVLVHDAARPFLTPALVVRLCAALDAGAQGVVPAVPVTDTVKEVAGEQVVRTPDRRHLRAVQTPQAFRLSSLLYAHQKARDHNWEATDDASLLEQCGLPVSIVPGEAGNRKITYQEDLLMLQEDAAAPLPCTGWGYDVHRYGPGRPMKLGGIAIPNAPEVQAHSDGDVLLHALMDALLGCIGDNDIGFHFPDSAAAFENVDSAVLLDEVLYRTHSAGLRIVHVDLTLIAQIPKISPCRDAIRRNVARLLGLSLAQVNVKATTEEGMGFTGAREGIKAVAVVTGLRPAPSR